MTLCQQIFSPVSFLTTHEAKVGCALVKKQHQQQRQKKRSCVQGQSTSLPGQKKYHAFYFTLSLSLSFHSSFYISLDDLLLEMQESKWSPSQESVPSYTSYPPPLYRDMPHPTNVSMATTTETLASGDASIPG